MERPLYTYEHVRQPFDEVARLLAEDPAAILQPATDSAAQEARTLRSALRVELGHFEVRRDITIDVGEFEAKSMLAVSIPIRWRASTNGGIFPAMTGWLELQAMSLRTPLTQVTLLGSYEPPGGVIGAAADALLGRRVAKAAIVRFLQDVVDRIDAEMHHRATAMMTG